MRRASVAVVALAVVLAAPASAGTWDDSDREGARHQAEYDKAMSDGDQAAILAAGGATSPKRLKQLVLAAARSYERAAEARPDQAEPHWRAANVLYGFFVDCDPAPGVPLCIGDTVDKKLYHRILGHWDAFETNAPLDPRMDDDFYFDRAILHTKLATTEDLEHAVADYETILARFTDAGSLGLVLGNLAESYMMLGDLDDAIQRYQDALRERQSTSVMYGLAVAYDRDGQGAKAREIIVALGEEELDSWRKEVEEDKVFYVPEGEVFYYAALANEALGHAREAIRAWKRYLESGAHPRFQPRARDNLRALELKVKAKTR